MAKKHDKLLAEWFWIDRWDGSSAALLNMECQGVYRSMLSQAWRRGARLPNDHAAIRRAIRCSAREWSRTWPKIERYWRVDGDELVNDTQLEVYAEAKRILEAQREKGQKRAAGAPRAGGRFVPSQPPARTPAESPADTPAGRPAAAPPKHQPPSLSPGTDNEQRIRQASAGGGPKANPFVTGKRDELELESFSLSREIADLKGEPAEEVFADAAHYVGAERQKVNPANMTDDRLLNTVIDLRATLREEQAKRAQRA